MMGKHSPNSILCEIYQSKEKDTKMFLNPYPKNPLTSTPSSQKYLQQKINPSCWFVKWICKTIFITLINYKARKSSRMKSKFSMFKIAEVILAFRTNNRIINCENSPSLLNQRWQLPLIYLIDPVLETVHVSEILSLYF